MEIPVEIRVMALADVSVLRLHFDKIAEDERTKEIAVDSQIEEGKKEERRRSSVVNGCLSSS